MTIQNLLDSLDAITAYKIFENHVTFDTKDLARARIAVYTITKNLGIIYEETPNLQYLRNQETLEVDGIHPLTLLEVSFFYMNCLATYQPKIKVEDFYEINLKTLPMYGYDINDVRRTTNILRRYLQTEPN